MPNNFDDILKFCTPARWWGEKWREGLYLGNGKMGANVYGGASEEKILFNEATFQIVSRKQSAKLMTVTSWVHKMSFLLHSSKKISVLRLHIPFLCAN